MPIYKQTTEITNIDKIWTSISKDIVEVYFGDKNVFSVWAEIENALPLTVYASGDDLVNYKVFGNTESGESVGERTENLFDANGTENYGYYAGGSGQYIDNKNYKHWRFPVKEGDIVRWTYYGAGTGCLFYKGNYVTHFYSNASPLTIPSGVDEITNNFTSGAVPAAMVTLNQPIPTSYIPYGYQLPMVVTNGTTTTTTPIYIGSDPLADDEYVDFGGQKVYKRTSNLFDIRKVASNIVTITGNNEFQKAETEKFWYDLFGHQTSDSPTRKTDTTKCLYLEAGTYTLSGTAKLPDDDYADLNYVLTAQSNGTILASSPLPYTFTLAADNYITIRIGTTHRVNMSQIMITAGSETPSTYESYLTPTDPPVAIPTLPTIDGETIIDYNPSETPAVEPEKMYVKYRKQGT